MARRKTETPVVETPTTATDGIEFIEKAFAEAPEPETPYRKANPLAVSGFWTAALAIAAAATAIAAAYGYLTGITEIASALILSTAGYASAALLAPTALALSFAGYVAASRTAYWYGKTAKGGKGTALTGIFLSAGLLTAGTAYAISLLVQGAITSL